MSTNQKPRVAYFCMEYGLDNSLPLYCGGLGILAGDYLKAARDMDVPVVGIGILWRQDYTNQYVGNEGWPFDTYATYDYENVEDTGITVNVRVRGNDVNLKVWKADNYGNVPLYLLDAGYPDSPTGWMTSKLYGGEAQDRIASEIILGIGGVRALRALGVDVDLYHFNEGHAAFAGFELIREKMSQEGKDFETALNELKNQVIFTTHTPVLAGNESHDIGLLEYMEANNGLSTDQLRRLGGDPFNMTVAGLHMCFLANGVSQLHTETAKRMWNYVDDRSEIIGVTNGVHAKTWQDQRVRLAYENNQDLWEPHMEAKKELLQYIKQKTDKDLDLNVLTIGFARRAAPYKRGELIFRNTDAIDQLLSDNRLQLIFAGKAHPNDGPGKEIIQKLNQMAMKYPNNVIFLENYDMHVGKLMTSGADVWLNNPKRPMEASGTSGMKAAMNGCLNLSVVDGWVAEGPEHDVSGWLIDEVFKSLPEKESEDARDLQALYHLLYENVIPTYYENRQRWVDMMKESIQMAQHQFSAYRMVEDYYNRMYNLAYEAQKAQSMVTV